MMSDKLKYPTPRFEWRWDKKPQVPDWMKTTWAFIRRPWRYIAMEFDIPFTNATFALIWDRRDGGDKWWWMDEQAPGYWVSQLFNYRVVFELNSHGDIATAYYKQAMNERD